MIFLALMIMRKARVGPDFLIIKSLECYKTFCRHLNLLILLNSHTIPAVEVSSTGAYSKTFSINTNTNTTLNPLACTASNTSVSFIKPIPNPDCSSLTCTIGA